MKRAILWAVLPCAAGCTDTKDPITGTQSIGVELVSPSDPGEISRRLPDTMRSVTVNLTAYDADHNVDTSFENQLQIYAQFLGTLTPSLSEEPNAPALYKVAMTDGVAKNVTLTLPPVFGQTTLWVDDGQAANPTYATGTSPVLWFRDPTIADLQTPVSETALDALTNSPLNLKQVTVSSSRYGANGRLVVTSVYTQGYTVADVNCADANGTPPCVAGNYDHMVVFSFSAPTDQTGKLLQVGQVIDSFTGGVSEFNGLTEMSFPSTMASSSAVDLRRLPAPATFSSSWFGALSNPDGRINFERHEAGPIEVLNAKVCDLDDDFTTYGQWKIDPAGVGGNCDGNANVLNVVTTGVISGFDPSSAVGKTAPRIVGILRPVEIGSFNVWIIYPRTAADLTLQ